MEKTLEFDFPPPFEDLFIPHRYKVYYGGRGSAKSWSVARALLIQAIVKDMTILCAREIQNSINDSVHRLLREQIGQLGLDTFYDVTKNTIYRRPLYRKALGGYDNGSEFIFKGLRFNSREIKSTEGVNVAWVEEGQAVSADSWDILIPTIREPNSEIWITFNPLDESDPTYQRFVLNPPDNAYIRKVNYDENPYFPEVLRQEMEWLKSRDYQSYLHVWEGEVRKHSNALIFGGYFRVEDFETPRDARFYHGIDLGFAQDPSTLVRCFIKDKTLYIDQEAWGFGVEIDELPQLFDSIETARKWPLYADCSRPETISYVRRQGFNIKPCKKWQGSIEDGIEFLKTFDIVIHPRCKHIIDEFNHYSYKVDKQTGDILPVIVDSWNHGIDGLRYSLTGLIKGRGAMHIDSKALMNTRFKRR